MRKKIFKNIFISYLCLIVFFCLIIKFKIEIIEENELFNAFDTYISKTFLIAISIVFGCAFYKLGFENKQTKIIKRIIGYISFSVSIIFINIIFTIALLTVTNLLNFRKAENILIKGKVIEYNQYKLSKTIIVREEKSNKIYLFSVSKKYSINNNFEMILIKGKLNILYK